MARFILSSRFTKGLLAIVFFIVISYLLFNQHNLQSTSSGKDASIRKEKSDDAVLYNNDAPLDDLPYFNSTILVPVKPAPVVTRRANACFVILARNRELAGLIHTIPDLEKRFNNKYNYPYVFLNDKPFTNGFKKTIRKYTKSNVTFGLVPKEHWSYPSWINQTLASEARYNMRDVMYGDSESYRHMCRYQSGFFFRHPLLESYDYYWRVEPGVKFLCDIDYDPFLYLKDNDIQYGFTISLTEIAETIPTLWNTTKEFMRKHPEYIGKRNTLPWVTDSSFEEYNGCHFWSNFEIASFKWLRSEKYLAYFDYLDQAGGYFYERWGDAPVHSLALSMFLPPEQIHWFSDIGYFHSPFTNCPIDPVVNVKKCQCDPDTSLYFAEQSCTKNFLLVDRKPAISLSD